MSTRRAGWVGSTASVAVCLFLAGAVAGPVAARVLHERPRSSEANVPAFTEADFDSGTEQVRGTLSPAVREVLADAAAGSAAMLVVVRGRDLAVCEDLGRQLRELKHQASPDLSLVLVTEPESVDLLKAFDRRERLRASLVAGVAPDGVIEGRRPLATPAVLVTGDSGSSARGVAHTLRFPNVRLRSFADELRQIIE